MRETLEMRNTTINKSVNVLKCFLRWAEKKGYHKENAYINYVNRLKTIDKKVIFLEWEELMTIYNFDFPETKKYLDRVRDVFCFCCFTSLRYSDVYNLRRADVRGDAIHVTTIKTDDSLVIELR